MAIARASGVQQVVNDTHALTSMLERMRAHFNCLSQIEATHGDLTNPDRLREVLRQNSFLLGLESSKNKNMQLELQTMKRSKDRLREEKMSLEAAKNEHVAQLEEAKSKLYDIDFDEY